MGRGPLACWEEGIWGRGTPPASAPASRSLAPSFSPSLSLVLPPPPSASVASPSESGPASGGGVQHPVRGRRGDGQREMGGCGGTPPWGSQHGLQSRGTLVRTARPLAPITVVGSRTALLKLCRKARFGLDTRCIKMKRGRC